MSGKQNIELRDCLKRYFGFDSFKGNQEAVIRNVLDGKDTFVLMPTGGGKSLCYQLPALMMDGVAIVISPLIALMKNQVDAMRTFSMEDGVAHFLNSSLNKAAVAKVKGDVLEGKTKLLYFAPESLTKEDNVNFLRISIGTKDAACLFRNFSHLLNGIGRKMSNMGQWLINNINQTKQNRKLYQQRQTTAHWVIAFLFI